MKKSLVAVTLLFTLLFAVVVPAHAITQEDDGTYSYLLVNSADGTRMEFDTRDELEQYMSQLNADHDLPALRYIPCGYGQHKGPFDFYREYVAYGYDSSGKLIVIITSTYYTCQNCGEVFLYRQTEQRV